MKQLYVKTIFLAVVVFAALAFGGSALAGGGGGGKSPAAALPDPGGAAPGLHRALGVRPNLRIPDGQRMFGVRPNPGGTLPGQKGVRPSPAWIPGGQRMFGVRPTPGGTPNGHPLMVARADGPWPER